jgi:DNA-binding CsgD family transcriptional regulator
MNTLLASHATLSAAFTADGMAAALQQLAEQVGAEGATMTYSRGETQYGAIFSEALQEYVPYYLQPDRPADPRAARVNPSLSEGFRLDRHDFTEDELAREPFFQEFLRPVGFGWHACASLDRSPSGDTVTLTLRRKLRQGDFEPGQLGALEAQLPLLRATTRVMQSMRVLNPLGAGRAGSPKSLFALDASGRACLVDGASDGLVVARRGRLRARGSGHEARISATLERAQALARQVSTVLADDEGDWWLFTVTPAQAMVGDAALTPFVTWATLTPYAPLDHASERAQQLGLVFGLSPGEARVAAHIGGAKTIEATALALGCATGTVRNHLKAIFSKVGVSRQAELVAVLGQF